MTIVERVSKFTFSAQIDDKSAATVTAATIALLEPYREAVLTITADNGKAFAYHEQVTKALDAQVYFSDPYRSLAARPERKHQRFTAAMLAKEAGLQEGRSQ